MHIAQAHPSRGHSSAAGCAASKLFTNDPWGSGELPRSPWPRNCWNMSRNWPIVAFCGRLVGKVVGPLNCSWFENDDGGLSCTVGSRSDLPDGWLTPTNSGILVVRLNGPGESGALSRGTLVPALPLAVELTDAAWLRPNWSVSDLLNPTVLPDKRYRNTVCPVCLTFKSSSVSVGLGIFLPIIHFWTCTGKLNLSKTWRKHLDSFF